MEPSSNDPAAHATVLHPGGDLLLRVGAEHSASQDFIVSSQVVGQASPVWSAMLFGRFAESINNFKHSEKSQWIVQFPEDDPQAMKVVLAIIHTQHGLVPSFVSSAELYEILVITQKYDMTRYLKDWQQRWVSFVARMTPAHAPQLMCIAYELGYVSAFRSAVDRWVCSSFRNRHGVLYLWEGFKLTHYELLEASGVPDDIEDTRVTYIQKILNTWHETVDCLSTSSMCVFDKAHPELATCEALVRKDLKQQELDRWSKPLPRLEGEFTRGSLDGLLDFVADLKILKLNNKRCDCRHKNGEAQCHSICSFANPVQAMKDKVRAIGRPKVSFIMDRHEDYMAAQAKAMGIGPSSRPPPLRLSRHRRFPRSHFDDEGW